MTERVLEELGGTEAPVDPGGRFRDRLWQLVDAELTAQPTASGAPAEPAVEPATAEPPLRRARPRRGFAGVRSSRARVVSVAAGLVAVLTLGAAAYLVGDSPAARHSIEVADDHQPAPKPDAASREPLSITPGPVPSRPPSSPAPAVRGAAQPPVGQPHGAPVPAPGPRVSTPPGSPRGRLQVLYSALINNDFDVYLATAGSDEEPRTLVGGRFLDRTAVLSPGGRLYWTRFESGTSDYELWTASADGRDRTRMRPPGCDGDADCVLSWPAFAADGTRMAFSRGHGETGCSATQDCDELVVYDPGTGMAMSVGYGIAADWSPRRNEIVYAGHESATSRNTSCAPGGAACPGGEIRIVDLSGSAPVSRVIGGETGHTPRFSPDGEWIAFERSFASSSNGRESVVMRRDGTDKRVLTACGLHPTWTPDGELACVVQNAAGSDVFTLDVDDQPDEQLTFTPETEYFFRLYER
ncbi:MAG TPA: hypothetical protein VNA12_08865 [Mycobacteriales bacterium]|nr:hypothetical protein [Mycobacteriales bacterium]